MLNIHINTMILVLVVILIVAMVNIILNKLLQSPAKNSSILSYSFNKMIYNLKSSEINKDFFLKSFYLSLGFVFSILPVFYYYSNSNGYDLEYLLSSVNEKDFLLIWVILAGLCYYPKKPNSVNHLYVEFSRFFTLLTYTSILFLIIIKRQTIGFQSYSIMNNVIATVVLLSLFFVTRMIVIKPVVEKFKSLSLQQLYSLSYNLFQFSICMISAAFIQRALQIHVEEVLERYMELLWATIIFLIFKIENLVWSKNNSNQDFYLFQKYQRNIQFGIIIFLCITSYYF